MAIWAEIEACLLGSDRAGKKGRQAECIGRYVASNLIQDINSRATADRFLADQLIIYAAPTEGITEYIIPMVTDHIEANLWLIDHVLGRFGVETKASGNRLRIKGIGYCR